MNNDQFRTLDNLDEPTAQTPKEAQAILSTPFNTVPSKSPTIRFGPPDFTWGKYGLAEIPLRYNEGKSGYKAVVRNEKLVAIVGEKYKLVPNEEAVKLADQVLLGAGFVPFHEFTGNWFTRMKDHVIYDKHETRVHAL